MTIPAEHIRPYVLEFIDDIDARVEALAESAKVSADLIQRLRTGSYKWSIEFDTADRILCACDAVDAWYTEPLDYIYLTHRLREIKPPKDRCERRGCMNPVRNAPPGGGGKKPRFCSDRCQATAAVIRRKGEEYGQRYSNQFDQCIHGHDWSPENTYVNNGKRFCRECKRIRNRVAARARRQRAA